MILRPYQEAAIRKLRAEFASGKKRVVLYSPTGSGKSEMGMEMIRLARSLDKKVLFVCNRVELVTQASRRFHAARISHGIIQGSNSGLVDSKVLICSIQTLDRRGYPDADFIVIDEAHGVAGAKSYHKLLEHFKSVPVVGLTATPFSKGLGKQFQNIVKAATIRELVELGFLVDCDIYAPSQPDLSEVQIVAGDYNETQLGLAVDKADLIGDIVAHWFKLANHKPTVVFATNILHSTHIVDQFKQAGITAEHIDCYTDEEDRQKILARFREGTTKIISNVGILAEGWDCPHTEVMILARPTRSLIRYIQMAGRILRPSEGKDKALILDHSGTVFTLGYPTDDLPLELDMGVVREKKAMEVKKKLPSECIKCKYMKAPSVHTCPMCGFAPEKKNSVETDDGELEFVVRSKQKRHKQDFYSELLQVAHERHHSHGWVAHAYKSAFGVWPKGLNHIRKEPSPETISYVQHLMIRYIKSKGAKHAA